MNDVQTQVRDTFEAAGAAVPVPPFDEVRFRARVRGVRRRRTGRLVASVVAAASVVALALVTVPPLLSDDAAEREPGVVVGGGAGLAPEVLPQPLYYLAGRELVAATPDGALHRLGRFEELVGTTAEGVLAVDERSRLVWINASSSGEGDGGYAFSTSGGPVALPVTGPVQGAALSADGRYLAWLDLDDVVTVHDLKAGTLRQSLQTSGRASLVEVSGRGVLLSEEGRLRLVEADGAVAIPTSEGGHGPVADTVGGLVTVADQDDVTRVFDVSPDDGIAKLVDSVPGVGRLAPYARAIVSVDGAAVQVWADGEAGVLGGIDGDPLSAGWLDERYVVVTAAESGGTSMYLCPVADLRCVPVAFSEDEVRAVR